MKEIPPDPQLSILFGCCLILLLALPFTGYTAWQVAAKAAALSWPATDAQVLTSEAYRTTKPALWCIKLSYRYGVDGKAYVARRSSSSYVAGVGCDRDKRVIDARLERMRPGDRIRVRYDPRDPGDAVVYLAPTLEWIDAFLGIVGLVWLGCGIALIRDGRRLRREQASTHVASAKPALR